MELPEGKEDKAEEGDDKEGDDVLGAPALVWTLAQGEEHREAGDPAEEKPYRVEARLSPRRLLEEGGNEEEVEKADGDVDVEDEAPREVLHEVAAEGGTDRRGGRHRQPPDPKGRPDLVPRDDVVEDGHRQGHDHPAPDGLEGAGGDEGPRVPGCPAEGGA